MKEPLSPSQVKKLLITILETGTLSFTGHAYEEMANDDLLFADLERVIATGRIRRRFRRDIRGVGYEVVGNATDEREVAIICRLKETGKLLFITTYALE